MADLNPLAVTVVDLLFDLSFATEEHVELDWALRACTDILSQIEYDYADADREAIKAAASAKLADLLREPDEHGYTPRKLVTAEQKQFLEAIAAGQWGGP